LPQPHLSLGFSLQVPQPHLHLPVGHLHFEQAHLQGVALHFGHFFVSISKSPFLVLD
jgi:hypothetical protein